MKTGKRWGLACCLQVALFVFGGGLGSALGQSTLTNGLVACWHFNSDATLTDDTGPRRAALQNIGGVTFDADQSPYGNGSAYFDGNSYLRPLNGGYLPDGPCGADPFSFACWFKVDDGTGDRQLFVLGKNEDGHAVGLRLENDRTKCLSYLWGTANECYVYPTDGTGTFAGAWHSIVHVWDGTTFRIFIDGADAELIPKSASITRTPATAPDLLPTAFLLGASHNSGKWLGWIDEAALWNRALTSDEIAAYIANGVPADATAFPGTDYTITSETDVIPLLTGSDKLTVNIPVGESIALTGNNSGWHGVLDILQGIVTVSDSAALGSATIFNTNETFSAKNAANARLDFYGAVTAANTIRLGTETPLNNGPRIISYGNTTLNGPLYVWNSFLRVADASGSLTLGGNITCLGGYYFVLQDSSAYYDTRIFITGRFLNLDTLWPDGNSTGVKFLSPNQIISYPMPTQGGTITFGMDNVFPSSYFLPRNAGRLGYLDLNGTMQSFLNNNERAKDVGIRIRNSNENAKGVFRLTQTVENAAARSSVVGPLDFVKSGSELLVLTGFFEITGTLDVEEGTLKLTGPQTCIASQVVVRAGATLDLGGNSYRCTELTLAGGTVQNGTLLGVTNILASGSVGATLAGGVTVKQGGGEATLEGGLASGHDSLTDGLVCCYHFDSAESLLQDSGPFGYTLENCWTNGSFKVSASNGPVTFDASEGRYGSGCASFSEHVFLSYPGGYPAKAPRDGDPFTLAQWFKIRDGKQNDNRGLSFLGRAADGNGLGLVVWNRSANLFSYLWGAINELLASPTDGTSTFAGGWHCAVQVWDGNIYRVYIDGRESELTPRTASVVRTKHTMPNLSATHFWIGAGYNNMYFSGWLDEVAMWNRALSPTEIAAYIEGGVKTEGTAAPQPATLEVTEGSVSLTDVSFAAGLTNGIVLNYRFDTPETLYQDSGPYGYTLTEGTRNMAYLTGGTKVTCATGEGEWVHGGGAAYFDGTNNLVLAGYNDDGLTQPEMIPLGDAPFTLGFFFRRADKYPANTGSAPDYTNMGLIYYGDDTRNVPMTMNGYAFWDWQSRLWNYPNGFAYEYLLPTNSATTKKFRTGWHSVVQTWDGTIMKYWIDGVETTPALKNPNNSARTPETKPDIRRKRFYISGAMNNPFFKGWMDDVTIWNRALSEKEVLAFIRFGFDVGTGADTNVTVNVAANGTLAPLGSELVFGGTLGAGGTFTGDLTLRDGVTVRSETGRTMAVSGRIAVEGTGTLQPESEVSALPAVWTPFAAAGGYAAEAANRLAGWRISSLPNGVQSLFWIEENTFNAKAFPPGLIMMIK